MKKKWLTCFFIYAIIIVVIVAAVLIYKGIKSHYGGYVQEEVVVENKISIKAKEIHDYMRENNYGYCTYDSRCEHEGECGLNATFESSKNGAHNTCCATYVSWVLQETGYITKKEHVDNNFNAANNLSKYFSSFSNLIVSSIRPSVSNLGINTPFLTKISYPIKSTLPIRYWIG